MNILPKKRWHVRTKDNIARVRRDEAQAAEEEKQRVQRAKLAEQEARTAFLRNKARSNFDGGYGESKKEPEADIYTSDGNINFFKDLEEGKNTEGSNKEYEEEKKAEQEKYEKRIGYLTYLGQDSIEATGGKAWYELDASKVTKKDDVDVELQEVGLKSKSKIDPINDIIKYTGLKIGKTVKVTPKLTRDTLNCSISTVPKQGNQTQDSASSVEYIRDHHKKHRKKHKKEHKKRKKLKKKMSCEYSGDEDDKKKIRDKERYKNNKRRKDSSSDNDDSGLRKRRKTGNCRKSHEKDRYKQKCKRKHKSKSHSSSSSNNSSSITGCSSQSSCDDEEIAQEKQRKLEVLRAERLRREAEERQKAEKLLAGKKSDSAETPGENKPVFQQKYNSQYNPHIARQNQEPKTLEAGVKYWLQ